VHPPQRAQHWGPGNAELDHGDPTARLDDPRELAHRRRAVVYVAQQVGEAQRIELRVGERKLLGLAQHEADLRSQLPVQRGARPSGAEHRLALIDRHDLATRAPGQRRRDHPGAGGDVQDALSGPRLQGSDQRPAPARILAEAEQRAHAVVVSGQALEQAQGVALARGWAFGSAHRREL